jgi:hypothetical protein
MRFRFSGGLYSVSELRSSRDALLSSTTIITILKELPTQPKVTQLNSRRGVTTPDTHGKAWAS